MRVPKFLQILFPSKPCVDDETEESIEVLTELSQIVEDNHQKNIAKASLLIDRLSKIDQLQNEVLQKMSVVQSDHVET